MLGVPGTAWPEHGIDTEFAHFANENDKVMTQDFTKRFIGHRNIGFASRAISELRMSVSASHRSAACF
jgi:hypothetical protein